MGQGPVPEPLEVRHERTARRIVLTWDDGHVSVFPLDYLRSWCPCAGCQGHAPTASYLGLVDQSLTQISAVGNYALTPSWADGHDTGIYSFRMLRQLCPCEACGGPKA
jgi:DUF971 family protein